MKTFRGTVIIHLCFIVPAALVEFRVELMFHVIHFLKIITAAAVYYIHDLKVYACRRKATKCNFVFACVQKCVRVTTSRFFCLS